MDRLIHLSLNSLDIALRKQAISAQNLSNINVTGYRRDVYENFASLYLRAEDQLDTRAFAVTTGSGEFDEEQGRMRATHRPQTSLLMAKAILYRNEANNQIH